MSVLDLLSNSYLKEIENNLGTSVLVALARKQKIVSGKTAQSIRNELLTRSSDLLEMGSFGGEGMQYIIEGKRAGTKLPVRKVGDHFELVQALKDWKSLVGFKGSDYLLAKAIAENSRQGVDIPGMAADVFQERYVDNIQEILFDLVLEEFKKENNATS